MGEVLVVSELHTAQLQVHKKTQNQILNSRNIQS